MSDKKSRFYEFQVEEEHQQKALSSLHPGEVWTGFKAVTSAHGIPHVNNARGFFKVSLWVLATLISVALLILLAIGLFEKYYANGVNVRVDVIHRTRLTFPAVTVCNHNPVRQSMIEFNDKLNTLFNGDSSTKRRKKRAVTPLATPSPTPAPGSTPAPTPGATPTSTPGAATTPALGATPTPTPAPGATPAPASGSTPAPAPSGVSGAAASGDSDAAASGDSDVAPSGDSDAAPSGDSDAAPSGDSDAALSGDSNALPSGDSDVAPSGDIGDAPSDTDDNGFGFGGGGPSKISENLKARQDGRAPRADYEKRMKFMKIIAEMALEEKEPLGHQFEDFVLDCEYSGYECLESDFSTFYNNVYGNCYTFNSGWNSSIELQTSFRPGPNYGLQMTFNIDQDEYQSDLAQTAGVRVVIHPQERMPFPEDEGMSVNPGQMSFIGLRMLSIAREGGKYGNCTDISTTNFTRNVFEETHPVNYSSSACYKTCYQRYIMKDCKCGDTQYPVFGEAFAEFGNGDENYTLPACDITDEEQVECMENVTAMYMNDELDCYCPQACDETSYTPTVSAAYWPSERYRDTLFESLASDNTKIRTVLNSKEDPDKYQKNLVKLVVYFEEFNFEKIEEYPAYQAVNFVSDIGGILGLFLGFSVLTILEFFELGLDFLLLAICKCCRRSPKSIGPRLNSAVSSSQIPLKATSTLHSPSETDLYPTNSPPPQYSTLNENNNNIRKY